MSSCALDSGSCPSSDCGLLSDTNLRPAALSKSAQELASIAFSLEFSLLPVSVSTAVGEVDPHRRQPPLRWLALLLLWQLALGESALHVVKDNGKGEGDGPVAEDDDGDEGGGVAAESRRRPSSTCSVLSPLLLPLPSAASAAAAAAAAFLSTSLCTLRSCSSAIVPINALCTGCLRAAVTSFFSSSRSRFSFARRF